MNTVIPGQTADDANRTVINGNNNCAQCSAPKMKMKPKAM